MVINTCGWVQAEGYDHIKHIAQVRIMSVKLCLDIYDATDLSSFVLF